MIKKLVSILSFAIVFSCSPAVSVDNPGVEGQGGTKPLEPVEVCESSSVLCPLYIPEHGESCVGLSPTPYCEYTEWLCKSAVCRTDDSTWEIREMNPCECFDPNKE